jgi:RecA-family ATPase
VEQSEARQVRDDFSIAPLRITDPIRLQGAPIPDRRWLWTDWVPMRATTIMYGDGGTGKSLLMQQLMTACATGQRFLAHDVQRCKVLGVFCEDDDEELHRRQDSINRGLGIDFGDLEDMHWISRTGEENLLMTFSGEGRGEPTALFQQILSAAKMMGAQLVIIDTAADTFGGNENIRPQVRQFISLLNRLAQEIDGAVILLAHPSQTGKSSGSGDGGSTAWSNSARSRLYLTRPVEEGQALPQDADARVLSRMKSNYSRLGEQVSLFWKDGSFQVDVYADAVANGDPRDRRRQAQDAFCAGLTEITERGERCNVHKGQANYAPRAIHDTTEIGGRFSMAELADAMNRLLKDRRIQSIEEGPKSRKRTFLKLIGPTLEFETEKK